MKIEKPAPSVLDGIEENLPAHIHALRLQQHAAQIGFDWDNLQPIFAKLAEETHELQAELAAKNIISQRILDEFGDILFVCINLARHLNIDPEVALQHANQKFEQRFRLMEHLIQQAQLEPQQLDLVTLEQFWQRAKN